MKRILLLAASLMIAAASFAQPADKDELAKELLGIVNKYRSGKGLEPLELDNKISKIAEEHSERMAKGKTGFGHGGFDARYEKLGKSFKGMGLMAENVCMGGIDAQRVFKLWVKSSGHKKNMESKTNMTGIGVAEGKNGDLYVTMIYIYNNK